MRSALLLGVALSAASMGSGTAAGEILETQDTLEQEYPCPWAFSEEGEAVRDDEARELFFSDFEARQNAQYIDAGAFEHLKRFDLTGAHLALLSKGVREAVSSNPVPFIPLSAELRPGGMPPLRVATSMKLFRCIPANLAPLAPDDILEEFKPDWLLERLTLPLRNGAFLSPMAFAKEFSFRRRKWSVFHESRDVKRSYENLQDAGGEIFSTLRFDRSMYEAYRTNSLLLKGTESISTGFLLFTGATSLVALPLRVSEVVGSARAAREAWALFLGGVVGFNVVKISHLKRALEASDRPRTLGRIVVTVAEHELKIVVLSAGVTAAMYTVPLLPSAASTLTRNHAALRFWNRLPATLRSAAERKWGFPPL